MLRFSFRSAALIFALVLLCASVTVVAQDTTPTPDGHFSNLLDSVLGTPTPTAHANTGSLPISGFLSQVETGRLEDGGFYLGDLNAPITIVEFADWACPHCLVYRDTMYQVINDFVVPGLARFELRMFPTAGGRQSVINGMIAECTHDQIVDDDGNPIGFWLASDVLFQLASTDRYEGDAMMSLYSRFLQVDQEIVMDCANTLRPPQVLVDIQLGIDSGVSGTPSVMVRYAEDDAAVFIDWEDRTYSGGGVPYDVLSAVILKANGYAPDGSDWDGSSEDN